MSFTIRPPYPVKKKVNLLIERDALWALDVIWTGWRTEEAHVLAGNPHRLSIITITTTKITIEDYKSVTCTAGIADVLTDVNVLLSSIMIYPPINIPLHRFPCDGLVEADTCWRYTRINSGYTHTHVYIYIYIYTST